MTQLKTENVASQMSQTTEGEMDCQAELGTVIMFVSTQSNTVIVGLLLLK